MENILKTLVGVLLPQLPPDIIKKSLDSLLDTIENYVQKSETKLDDAVIFPAIKYLREQLNVPDYPDTKEDDKK